MKQTAAIRNARRWTAAPLALGALALMLAGCSREEAEGESPTLEEAQAEADKLEKPEPGEYRQTVEIEQLSLPGASGDLAEQIRAMIEENSERTYCLTKEQAEEGFAEMYRRVTEEQDCEWNRFAVDNGTMDAQLLCDGAGGGTLRFTMNGDVSATGSDVRVHMEQSGGPVDLDLAMNMRAERLGDCAEAAAG